jgi:hypothetical protein
MKNLYDMCISDRKKLVTFINGTHNDTCIQPDYFSSIVNFWREYIDTTV